MPQNKFKAIPLFSDFDLLDEVPALIWKSDTQGNIIYFNKTWLEFRGKTINDELNSKWVEGLHPDFIETAGTQYGNALEKCLPFDIEYRLMRNDGEYRNILARGKPVFNKEGKFMGYVGTSIDITERKLAEENLQMTVEKLNRKTNDLETFAYVASHDLKDPLRKLLSFSERIENFVEQKNEDKIREYAQIIHHSAKKMAQMIEGLLDYAQIEKLPKHEQQIDLNTVVQETLDLYKHEITLKKIHVEIDHLPLIYGQDARVRQLFQNLISNAIKFTAVTHKPSIKMRYKMLKHCHKIEVEDNGIGFSKDDVERIFQPLQRLNSKAEFEGTGLGLAICKKIMETHGGTIKAMGKKGKGAKIILEFPLNH